MVKSEKMDRETLEDYQGAIDIPSRTGRAHGSYMHGLRSSLRLWILDFGAREAVAFRFDPCRSCADDWPNPESGQVGCLAALGRAPLKPSIGQIPNLPDCHDAWIAPTVAAWAD